MLYTIHPFLLTQTTYYAIKQNMLRIRLSRVGKKNSPSFRLVVTPRRTAVKTGRFLEILGFYNPRRHERSLKGERIQYWLSKGAQPSDSVRNMLIQDGIIKGEKVAVHKKPKKAQEKEATSPDIGKKEDTSLVSEEEKKEE